MTTWEDFYAAICSEPENDTIRLVASDWLQEQGECAKAEFIKVQIELAKYPQETEWVRQMPVEQWAGAKHTKTLLVHLEQCRRREAELLAMHESAWHADLSPVLKRFRGKACGICTGAGQYPGPYWCIHCHGTGRVGGWVRGFCGEVSLTCAELIGSCQCNYVPTMLDGTLVCSRCFGAKVKGLAAALGLEPLLERVTLTDKRPLPGLGTYTWYDGTDYRDDAPENINREVFVLLKGYNRTTTSNARHYTTEQSAIDALSRACIIFCTQAAAKQAKVDLVPV